MKRKAIYKKFGDVRVGQFFIHGGQSFYKIDSVNAKFVNEWGYYDFDPIILVVAIDLN